MASAMHDREGVSSYKGKRFHTFTLSFKLRVIAETGVCGNPSPARKYVVDERRIRDSV